MAEIKFENISYSVELLEKVNNNLSRFVSGDPTYIVVGKTWEGNPFRVGTALELTDAERIRNSAGREEMNLAGWEQSQFYIYKVEGGEVCEIRGWAEPCRATPNEEADVIRLWVGGYVWSSRQREETHRWLYGNNQ